jgi:MYXO-CTERM domain-containing protein
MKKVVTLIGIAGLAAAANAQTGSAEWISSVDIAPDNLSATVTWSANMTGDTPFVVLSATIFDSLNTAGAEFGGITSWEVHNMLAELTGDLTQPGDAGEGDPDNDHLLGTNAGQLTVFGPYTSANPIDFLSFTWTVADGFTIGDGGDVVSYGTSTDSFLLWVGDDKDSADALDIGGSVTEASAMWPVVPTPASAALLGFGGLALVRRRR